MRDVLAILAGLIAIATTVPYLIDIVKRRTKPNIVTWFTWTLLTAIGTAAAFAAHQPQSGILTLATSIATGSVVILGVRYGIANFSLFDGLCQLTAIIGFIMWLVFDSPLIGIVIPIAIDFIGAVPTYRHAWKNPFEETRITYVGATLAAMLTIISLPKLLSLGLLYPMYLLLSDLYLAVIISIRQQRPSDSSSKSY